MNSKKQIYSSIFLLKSIIVNLFIIFSLISAQENLEQINDPDSTSAEITDSLIIKAPPVVNIIEEKFTIDGKAAYGNGVMVPDAEVMLLDTLEKTLQTTRTTTKLFGRFFGGRFKFENILPGEDNIFNKTFFSAELIF